MPGASSDPIDTPSDAGEPAVGGSSTGAQPNGNSGVGAGPTSGSSTGGNTSSSGSGSGASAGEATNIGGSAGEPAVEPSGGDGGAGPVVDECPNDPNKLAAGECGCGVPEAPSATNADCQTLASLLVHRYDFEGTGTLVEDRVGTADGSVVHGSLSMLDGKGVVLLGGGDTGAYVDLPNRLISPMTNATLEAWVTWNGGSAWQRIFDFGDSNAAVPEDNPASGKTYLFLTPRSGYNNPMAVYSTASTAAEVQARGTAPLAQSLSQVVMVVDDTSDHIALYVNGAPQSQTAWAGALNKINDVNAWLGRSQFSKDPQMNAVFHEFRIYGAALTAAQIASAYIAGPDPKFLAY